MFGFGRLAGYEYFCHLEGALKAHFHERGIPLSIEVVSTSPTASIRSRATMLIEAIGAAKSTAAGGEETIHLIGHSTGGLDARFITSPSTTFPNDYDRDAWLPQVRSVVTINTPHYGTPLAAFFTTVSGTRLLYAISLLTVTSLSLGAPPLAAFSKLVASLGAIDRAFGPNIQMVDRAIDAGLRMIGDQSREEVRRWLDDIRLDQGGLFQITPEAMDLFNGAVRNAPHVRYGSVVTVAPPPRSLRFLKRMRSPYAVLSATVYSTLHSVARLANRRYPYAEIDSLVRERLIAGLGRGIDPAMNDGIVPTQSMLWGELLYAGRADHLDVVGHFLDDRTPKTHMDWLTSGAQFNRAAFFTMVAEIARFLLRT